MSRRTTRRSLLAAAMGPLILPSRVLGLYGRPGPNSRVITGHIGLGAQGKRHLRRLGEQAAALCDVDRTHLHEAANLAAAGVRVFEDYRALLDLRDVDAVVIATPDHWHGLQTVHACEAGKDVYIETPACHAIVEAETMVRAAECYGSIVCGGERPERAINLNEIRAFMGQHPGEKITSVNCWGAANPAGGSPADSGPPPGSLNWKGWLGPARPRPYNPALCHETFRWVMDLGGGQLCHQGVPLFETVLRGLGITQLGRVQVQAAGDAQTEGLWNCPARMDVTWRLPTHGLDLHWSQPGPSSAEQASGTELHTPSEKLTLSGPALDEESPPAPIEAWLSAVETRETPPVEIGGACRAAVLGSLGNLSYQLGRALEWDEAAGQFVNDPQADLFLGHHAYVAGSPPGEAVW